MAKQAKVLSMAEYRDMRRSKLLTRYYDATVKAATDAGIDNETHAELRDDAASRKDKLAVAKHRKCIERNNDKIENAESRKSLYLRTDPVTGKPLSKAKKSVAKRIGILLESILEHCNVSESKAIDIAERLGRKRGTQADLLKVAKNEIAGTIETAKKTA